MFAVFHRGTGQLVSTGSWIQGPEHCVCGHVEHVAGAEEIGGESKRRRPLGCPVDGCWHNYSVPTKGIEIRRASRPGLTDEATTAARGVPTGPVVWADEDGLADAPFVSDPLADDLDYVEFDGPLPDVWAWDVKSRQIVVDVPQRTRQLARQLAEIDATLKRLDDEDASLHAAGAGQSTLAAVAEERARVTAARDEISAALSSLA